MLDDYFESHTIDSITQISPTPSRILQ